MTDETTCDLCNYGHVECPGLDVHCAAGEHCTATDSVCAMDSARDDHSPQCCHCQARMRP